ncbi:MAG: hypothetical protein A2504_12260 [Bdellovibrionales bacterium RIFOXYD12_FULL_39_22]|nr:MAG: hypothetical protein A2385_14110 [Bdellovibrionales bacterium RIFOXYB1_FULL_39_21]OFZ42535.1 MAG: hypothetical protein A2485_03620 [Bdellovibrionales bacterium RIFOXYC12_FULL_39_17]OFZ45814.1 MAG: hypothetical protein A2404_02335 [Bdellovibrionales bacterium RIFOXYC1_FULL_39_130]OFZ71909.1 MAG: hypothetical protein A2451_16230 [Bdellovibrionales bacterium RIFOXYC2_FULL_39_8]OFZ74747.1 MAG: hypothetical protein A2560_05265 [Bdellovibrionales bacterium RIFOXYD1_FULL_39_84]OFZ93126.1 MAG:
MVVPERDKGVRSFRIPTVFFNAALFFSAISVFVFLVLAYDYWNLVRQVYKYDLLNRENQQLKEQIGLFQMKLNSLEDDIDRISIFEKKLRIITGVEKTDLTTPIEANLVGRPRPSSGRAPNSIGEPIEATGPEPTNGHNNPASSTSNHGEIDGEVEEDFAESYDTFEEYENNMQEQIDSNESSAQIQKNAEFLKLKSLYEKKIALKHGQQIGYTYTQQWSDAIKKVFAMAKQYALFDYKFNLLRERAKKLEVDIHEIDIALLDRDSFLSSTPTLLPSQGWITSYYGHRQSPYSGRVKMHEGLDIGGTIGSPIVAPADGVVVFSGRKPGFGIQVQIDHGYGVETIYAHAQAANVRSGQLVKRGDIIAQVGNTGYSTGPHLHYEIRVNGIPVDPYYYILD